MKVIVLGTRGFPDVQGGIESHCQNLYPWLVRGGCDVTVLARKSYMRKDLPNYLGVKLIPLSCPKSKYFEAFLHTFYGVCVAKKMGCDILHVHAIGPSLLIPFARFLGLRVVMTHHGPDYQREKWGKGAKRVLRLGEKWGCRRANAIICVSRFIAEDIEAKYKKLGLFIPNGVNIPGIATNGDALREYGLSEKKYILAVGRFSPEKGFHELILSFKSLQDRDSRFSGQGYKLVIVGRADHPTEYSAGLEKMADGQKGIVLTGFLSGKPLQELYRHAGLFVLPSHYEGLPIVLLEAMSHGLSCIASDIPAHRNLNLLDEDRLFRAGDTSALSRKIEQFIERPLTDGQKRSQIARLAEEFSWEKAAGQTLKVYERVKGNA